MNVGKRLHDGTIFSAIAENTNGRSCTSVPGAGHYDNLSDKHKLDTLLFGRSLSEAQGISIAHHLQTFIAHSRRLNTHMQANSDNTYTATTLTWLLPPGPAAWFSTTARRAGSGADAICSWSWLSFCFISLFGEVLGFKLSFCANPFLYYLIWSLYVARIHWTWTWTWTTSSGTLL